MMAYRAENRLAVYSSFVTSYQITEQKSTFNWGEFVNASYGRSCENNEWQERK